MLKHLVEAAKLERPCGTVLFRIAIANAADPALEQQETRT